MSDHDGDPVGVALADLADAMPADPYRVDAVHELVRRRRTRRRVRRSALGVVAAAATVAGLVAIQSRPTGVTTVPAAAPTSTAPAACPARDQGGPPKTPESPDAAQASTQAKAAAAAKEAGAPGASASADGQRGFKGYGTLVAVSDTSVTIRPDSPAPDEPAEIVAAVTPDTAFVDKGDALTARPALAAGDRVVFGAQAGESGFTLLLLETNPLTAPSSGRAADKAAADKAAAAGGADDAAKPCPAAGS